MRKDFVSPFANEARSMLNAPSYRRKSRVKVVNRGAYVSTQAESIAPRTFGPRTKPSRMRKRMSGMLVFLNTTSEKKPKNRMRLRARKRRLVSIIGRFVT